MNRQYNLKNIRTLLIKGFTDQELRDLCHDHFKAVHSKLSLSSGKAEIVSQLLEYAEQKLQIEQLLALAKEANPARYEQHQSYYDPIPIHHYYATAPSDNYLPSEKTKGRQRIFLSYKRGVQPDESLALDLYKSLGQHHEVFIDQQVMVGTQWRERIQAELEACDFLILLLSEESAHSEMVEYEISTAHHLSRSRGGQPRILPIRVTYTLPFNYPLDAYLNHINWTVWNSNTDTSRLLDELLNAIAGGELSLADITAKASVLKLSGPVTIPRPYPFANPTQLERPDGTMNPESRFYIERPEDRKCQLELTHPGATIVIKAPRQMGKSSLLVRAMEEATRTQKAVVLLDFQLLDEEMLDNPMAFLKSFCRWIADELDLTDMVEEVWKSSLGNVQLCTKYIHHVLNILDRPLVLAMDEVDRMLSCPFRSDFFGMLRSWHNRRRPGSDWYKLSLLLVISTEPYLLINDLKQSPFNVGEVLRLKDFTSSQVIYLNKLHGLPFNRVQLDRLWKLLGGHPYLIRQAMYRVAYGEYDADTLLARSDDEDGPFSDHLKRHLFRFNEWPELSWAMHQIVTHHTCSDELLFYRLHSIGLVRREGEKILPRCGLYATYFLQRLAG